MKNNLRSFIDRYFPGFITNNTMDTLCDEIDKDWNERMTRAKKGVKTNRIDSKMRSQNGHNPDYFIIDDHDNVKKVVEPNTTLSQAFTPKSRYCAMCNRKSPPKKPYYLRIDGLQYQFHKSCYHKFMKDYVK